MHKNTQSVGRYKDLHNKTEIGLRRHEDLLSKREKQMIKIEKERSDLSMRVLSAEQEVTRLRDINEKHLNENMLRKAAAVAPPPPPPTFGGEFRNVRSKAILCTVDQTTQEAVRWVIRVEPVQFHNGRITCPAY